jgi:hypothetical protein
VNLAELRDAIAAEHERLAKRPVPTSPWAMPLGLDDLTAFIDVVESARYLSEYLGDRGEAGQRYRVARLDQALEKFS